VAVDAPEDVAVDAPEDVAEDVPGDCPGFAGVEAQPVRPVTAARQVSAASRVRRRTVRVTTHR
jgi:hypothetical protein